MTSSKIMPASFNINPYTIFEGRHLLRSFVNNCCKRSYADSPETFNTPICEISKHPAEFRTDKCSSFNELYHTGILNPAKGMSFAPNFSCRSYKLVFWIEDGKMMSFLYVLF